MILQSAASELELLEGAVREAGDLVRELMTKRMDIRSKGEAGPVTNIDLAVDALLEKRLREARPDYGWLSEESEDKPVQRMAAKRTFMLDPIDGTAALINKVPQFTISVGIVEGHRAFCGAIYNPMTDEMFLGAPGHGATRNGRAIHTSDRAELEGMRMIGVPSRFTDKRWLKIGRGETWPKMEVIERHSIAYRMALVAAGQGDGAILFGFKHDWDIAAGAAIVAAAGGRVTDPWGEALQLNQQIPRAPGVVLSGARLHPLLIERTANLPDPRKAEGT